MRLPRSRLTAVFTLLAILTIGDLPSLQSFQVLAQTPDFQKGESPQAGNGSNDADKVSIFETQASSYSRLLKTLVAQNKTDAALEIAERGRARAFVELLVSRLSSKTGAQSVALQQATVAPPTVEAIKRIAQEHQATLVSYSIIYDNFQVQGKQQTKESELFVWLVQPTGEVAFRRVDLKPLWQQNSSLSDLVASTRDSIGLRGGGTVSKAEKRQPKATSILAAPKGRLGVEPRQEERQTKGLQQLYQLLIQPIADILPKDPNARVAFIPQDSLFLVPFAALQDASGKYLIEQHSILTAPSIQVLDLTRQQRQRLGSKQEEVGNMEFLIVGNPSMPSVSPKPGEPLQQLPNLPGAEKEAKQIAQLLNTQALTGKEATKAAVLERMPKARIIHLATSMLVDKEQGLMSAIALAPSGNDNGLLTAGEIQTLRLNAELVVLSGCDSGLGTITGDGMIGLSRAFMSAGVPSAIVSLGYVADEATAFLMTEFYGNLSSRQNKAQALRNAMLATMKQYPNPKDWGTFTLIGEPE